MRLREPVEFLYLALMQRWERSAPPDKHQGFLDGEPERNTQISRFAYVITKVAAGNVERTFCSLRDSTKRNDGESYVSKNASWMKEPYPLHSGWYFEGCCNLEMKKEFLGHLLHLGLSRGFIECARDFVEGKSVEKYLPTPEEEDEVIKRYLAREEAKNA